MKSYNIKNVTIDKCESDTEMYIIKLNGDVYCKCSNKYLVDCLENIFSISVEDNKFLDSISKNISNCIASAYKLTEKEVRKSYKHVDDKIDAIQLFSSNIIKEIKQLTNNVTNVHNVDDKKNYQELPQYIILKDGTKKDCPIVFESKYAEEVLDFIIPLIGKGINFDPAANYLSIAANYPSIDIQKQWFEKNLRKYGYFGIDDVFSSKKYILSYKENKDFKEKGDCKD